MSQPFHLSAGSLRTFQRWCDAQSTDRDDIPLVEEVLTFIADHGWPPRITGTPKWPYFRDSGIPEHWIVARADNLWVVLRPHSDSGEFEFVTVVHPTADQIEAAEFLTEPPERND